MVSISQRLQMVLNPKHPCVEPPIVVYILSTVIGDCIYMSQIFTLHYRFFIRALTVFSNS